MRDRTSTVARAKTDWFKSSFSTPSQDCVEVRFEGQVVQVRDSKYRRNPANDLTHEPVITVTTVQWSILLDELTGRAASGANGAANVIITPCGGAILQNSEQDACLRYTEIEWRKFLAGVRNGEFDLPQLDARAS